MDFSLSLDHHSSEGPMSLDDLQPQFTYLDYLPNDGLMSLDESQPRFAILENHSASSNPPSPIMQTDIHTTVVEQSFSGEGTSNAAMGPPTKTRKKKAPTLRAEAWEPFKSRILDLHIKQNLPLPAVKKCIEDEFQFTAELRQYRSRISQWGLDKNVKSVEMKAIVRKRQQRRLVEDKGDLRFTVRGTTVEQHKIERWMKLNKVPESFLYVPSPAASTPSDVGCQTISEIGSPIANPSYSAASPYSLPGTPRLPAQSYTHTAFSSPALSIASLVRHQSSSFAGQSPAPIHRSLQNMNTFAIPFLPTERIPSVAAPLTMGSSNVRYRESEEIQMRKELSVLEQTYGINDERTLYYSYKLSEILRDQGRLRAAETMARQHLETLRRQEGHDEIKLQAAFQLLGTILSGQGLFAEAMRLINRTFEFYKRIFGNEHPETLKSMGRVMVLYFSQGLTKEAMEIGSQVVDVQRRVLGERSRETMISMRVLAHIYCNGGRLQEGERLALQVIEGQYAVFGPIHRDTLDSTVILAMVHIRQGRFQEAEEALRKTLGIQKEMIGEWHPDTLGTMRHLAEAWSGQGYTAMALSMMEACFKMRKAVLGPQHPHTLISLTRLRDLGTNV